MADDAKQKNYEDAGRIYRLDLYKETDIWSSTDDDLRVIAKCTRCGALVTGGLSREKHDAFHEALADLFDTLESLTSGEV